MKTKHMTEDIIRTTISIEDGPIIDLPDRVWNPMIQVTGMVVTFTRGHKNQCHFWGKKMNADGKPGKVTLDSDIFVEERELFPHWIQEILNETWTGRDN